MVDRTPDPADPADTAYTARNFRLFWASETLTTLTFSVSSLTVPLVAVTTLQASPLQLGLLVTAGQAAFAVVALPAGVLADRIPRRRLMMSTNLARALVVCTVPVAALSGFLHLWILVAVEVVLAVLQSVYEPAGYAFMPSLVPGDRLVAANGRIQATTTAADLGGKGLAGLLIQAVGAPAAVLANGVAFLLSVVALGSIRQHEIPPPRPTATLRAQTLEGLHEVRHSPLLRTLAIFLVGAAAGLSAYYALGTVFLARTVGLPAAAIGWILAAGGLGAVGSGLLTPRLATIFGDLTVLRLCTAVTFPFGLLIPLAGPGPAVVVYVVGSGLVAAGVTAYNLMSLSLTQAVCPPQLLGRVSSVVRLIVLAASAFGSTLGGILGDWLGPRRALLVVLSGLLAVPTLLLIDRRLRPDSETGSRRTAGRR